MRWSYRYVVVFDIFSCHVLHSGLCTLEITTGIKDLTFDYLKSGGKCFVFVLSFVLFFFDFGLFLFVFSLALLLLLLARFVHLQLFKSRRRAGEQDHYT